MHWNPANKRDRERKIRFTQSQDRQFVKLATEYGEEPATFLYEALMEAAESGFLESLIEQRKQKRSVA